MARPTKEGLDYFPLDVVLDDKFSIIEAEHGLVGFAISIKLLQKIYSEGYFYTWGEMEQILFSKAVSTDRNEVTSVVSDCLKWGLFSMQKFETYGILTSKGIQERYVSAIYKRANVEMINEYLLIDVSNKTNITCTSVSDVGNGDTSEVSDDKSTQSKVKESKVKESKTHTNTRARANKSGLESFDEFWKRYPNKIMQEQAASLWLSIDPDEKLIEEIMQGLDRWLASDQWDRGIYQSPVNWLRDKRWMDHPPKCKPKKEQAGSHHYQDEELQDLIARKMAKQKAART